MRGGLLLIGLGMAAFVLVGFWSLSLSGGGSSQSHVDYTKMELPSGGLDLTGLPPVTRMVYLDIAIDGEQRGRIDIGLFYDHVPITCENFRQLVLGTRGKEQGYPQSYVGASFHRIISDFVIQGGNLKTKDMPRTERSLYDALQFDDEASGVELRHQGRYIVQMANAGPDTNNAQFCIMLKAAPHLNGKHAVFGRVVGGFKVVDLIEELASSEDGVPRANVTITGAGEYPMK
jgi:cyclophilin family peptidyl-prolyl cis-trans isomerase